MKSFNEDEKGLGIGQRGIDNVKDGTSITPYIYHAKEKKSLTDEGEFIKFLTKSRPKDVKNAPLSIELPSSLYNGMMERMELAKSDEDIGKEYGGRFGYQDLPHGHSCMVVGYVEGDFGNINLREAERYFPHAKWIGSFHTHLYILELGGKHNIVGWLGGGHSGTDVANFFRRGDEELISLVVAENPSVAFERKIYCLLKTLEYSIPGSPSDVGRNYENKVIKLMAQKKLDQISASEQELAYLSRKGAFAFYTSTNDKVLKKT